LKSKGAGGPLFCLDRRFLVEESLAKGYRTMHDALMRLLEPPIEALGFELVDIEFAQAGRGGVLRIYIDRGAGEITVDDCATVSHAVSQVLEIEDPIKGHYTLEVSSPGFDRILRKRAHFERFIGARVFVELKLPIDGRRRFVGVLKSIAGDSIVVEVDGRAHELPLERIQKARLRPE
jgi:ribosome maturation factor RimP